MRPRGHLLIILAAAIGLAAKPATACNVPVFRYALERWKPDAYEAILFHEGPLTADLEELVGMLRKTDDQHRGQINLKLTTIDLRGTRDETAESLWKQQSQATTPWLVVRYPSALQVDSILWSGKAERAAVDRLLESPSRRELAARLLAGESVVWVVIDSGNSEQDRSVVEKIERELNALQKTVKLPDEEAQPGGILKLPMGQGEGLLSAVPLKIAFSVLRVSRAAADEAGFLATILETDPGLRDERGPIVVPVFGRGRALQAFPGAELDPGTIAAATEFLCGACSCSVKSQNPGMDLLLAANWEAALAMSPVDSDAEPADAGVIVAETLVPIPSGARPAEPATVAVLDPAQPATTIRDRPAVWILLGILGLVAAFGIGRFVFQQGEQRCGDNS